ncbi:hypothetical protein BDQ12DRAFT_716743 [Crucibulum laeve]|uniref:Uncharacterized protein n=1 Tax=Crucibulum laeve TaxID=68775 RepID=A0A5C3LFD6_9AGAR|nr:hypothetical protein BDQ12DRAFT_716743 [Crucibulum laeve]
MPPLSRSQRSSSSSCSIYNPKRYELGTPAWCLYCDYKGNPSNPEEGFLRSPLLVKIYIHIFTSLISAKDVKAQNGNATGEEDMEGITPPATYQCTLKTGLPPVPLCTPLFSSTPQRTTTHQGLDCYPCYYYIFDFCDDVDDDLESAKLVQNLLKCWNKQILPAAIPSGAIWHNQDMTEIGNSARYSQKCSSLLAGLTKII